MSRVRLRALIVASSLLAAGLAQAEATPPYAGEPALETPQAVLDAALDCTGYTHADKPPVLLVHGTFTAGFEQYDWTYKPLLVARGYDVCTITYPDRGFGDQQISAEYVVNALRRMHRESGRKVAVIGHSQGVSVPRWAIKWWPSAREAVGDFVMEAGPNHGTTVSSPAELVPLLGALGLPLKLSPAVFLQFPPNSNFTQALNRDDETPGDIDYTALYSSLVDELVQPTFPVPTAALDWQQGNPRVANIRLQAICPGRVVDHVSIGLFDRLAYELALDAIEHPGPADPQRLIDAAGGRQKLCGLLPIVPRFALAPLPQLLGGLIGLLLQEPANGLPKLHLVAEEPPLKPYAR